MFVLHAKQIMPEEWTKTDDVTSQQCKRQNDKGNTHNHEEFNQMTIKGSQLIRIRHQESGQEKEM